MSIYRGKKSAEKCSEQAGILEPVDEPLDSDDSIDSEHTEEPDK